MALNLGQFLDEFGAKFGGRFRTMIQNITDGVNQIGTVTGTDPTGHTSPPDPPGAINVAAAGGLAHVTLTDHSQRSRSLNYFVEYANEPTFAQPHVAHLGASRGTVLPLPNKTGASIAQSWYFRGYSMYPGSREASAHQVFGGSANPTPVDVGGSASLDLLPSTGAGTASSTGRRGGQGFGGSQFSTLSPWLPKAQ